MTTLRVVRVSSNVSGCRGGFFFVLRCLCRLPFVVLGRIVVLDTQELRVLIQSTKNEKQAEQHAEVEQEVHDPQQYGQPQLMPMDPHATAAAAHYSNYAHQSVDQDGGY